MASLEVRSLLAIGEWCAAGSVRIRIEANQVLLHWMQVRWIKEN